MGKLREKLIWCIVTLSWIFSLSLSRSVFWWNERQTDGRIDRQPGIPGDEQGGLCLKGSPKAIYVYGWREQQRSYLLCTAKGISKPESKKYMTKWHLAFDEVLMWVSHSCVYFHCVLIQTEAALDMETYTVLYFLTFLALSSLIVSVSCGSLCRMMEWAASERAHEVWLLERPTPVWPEPVTHREVTTRDRETHTQDDRQTALLKTSVKLPPPPAPPHWYWLLYSRPTHTAVTLDPVTGTFTHQPGKQVYWRRILSERIVWEEIRGDPWFTLHPVWCVNMIMLVCGSQVEEKLMWWWRRLRDSWVSQLVSGSGPVFSPDREGWLHTSCPSLSLPACRDQDQGDTGLHTLHMSRVSGSVRPCPPHTPIVLPWPPLRRGVRRVEEEASLGESLRAADWWICHNGEGCFTSSSLSPSNVVCVLYHYLLQCVLEQARALVVVFRKRGRST